LAWERAGTLKAADRVYRDGVVHEVLAREGVHVATIYEDSERPCVAVDLFNPTAPNRDYLRRRYGRAVCPLQTPETSRPSACGGWEDRPALRGPIRAPDVVGQSLVTIAAAGLRFSLFCGRSPDSRPRSEPDDPQPYDIEFGAIVTAQCPKPGTRVKRGEVLALDARASLGGGFSFTIANIENCRS
jgi:hypothetical protein